MTKQTEDVAATTRKRALVVGGVAGALASVSEARTAYQTVRDFYVTWQSKKLWTVELASDDPLYGDVLGWIDSLVTEDRRKALVARSDRLRHHGHRGGGDSVPDDSSSGARPKRQLTVTSDQDRTNIIDVGGYRVAVSIIKSDNSTSKISESIWMPDKLRFNCDSQEAQTAVLAQLDVVLQEREKADRQPTVRILDPRWNSWRYRGDLPPRPLASVVLAGEQLDRIVADLGAFLGSETQYVERALPWHRGYLFEGPPGTGKTSLARALASHFGMDLWYAPLGDVKDDSSLLSLLAEVHPRSMVLLEDVDVFAASHERQAENTQHVTLSGLLNALDGVATPHGLVTVMTTNKPRALDDALTRAGRMDVIETLELPGIDQATRLFYAFYKEDPPGKLDPKGRSTAELLELFKQNMHDPTKAYTTVRFEWKIR